MRPASILLGIATLIPSTAGAQSAPEAYSFYTIQGGDTLAIEQVVRTDERVDVDMLVRQRGERFAFTLELGPDATVRRVTNRFFRRPQDEEPTQTFTATFRGDSVDVEISGNGSQTMTVGTLPGALPWIRPSHALLEQALLRSQSMSGTADSIPFFNIANGQTATATVVWEGPDSATLRLAEATISAEVREDGSVGGLLFRGEGIRVVREDAFQRPPLEDLAGAGRHARTGVSAGGNHDVAVIELAETNHLFLADPEGRAPEDGELPSFDVPPEVLGAIADWLADRLERADG